MAKRKHLVCITGASKGIGLAISELLLEKSYTVCNISRSPSPLKQVHQLSIDLQKLSFEEELTGWLEDQKNHFSHLSLIHNAALYQKDTVSSLSLEDFSAVLKVNLLAPQLLNKVMLPYMTKGSAILYMGSTLSEKAVPHSFSYVTSKHATIGMMRATTQDLFQTGIHTAAICPGFTKTKMLLDHLGHNEKIIDRVKAKMGVEARLIDPQEIASVVLFCLENPVMNGSVVHAHLGPKES